TASTVTFMVTFSEGVNGVDLSDFALAVSGNIVGAGLSSVSGSGSVYFVTVNAGRGTGSLRLDVGDNDSITDVIGKPLGGPGLGNGTFMSGQSFFKADPTTVGGVVFLDANVNGVRDPGEAGLPGQIVYIDSNGNGVRDPGELMAGTDGGGAYLFG